LANFRCHAVLRLDLGTEPVVLVGANGTGKTSVLEALSLLAPGRGLRRARLVDMVRNDGMHTASGWSVTARLVTPCGPIDITTAFRAEGASAARDRRQISIDGRTARGRAAIAEAVGIVWLTPDMDRLFAEGPSARRRFLDRLVWGVDPAHASRVSAYERAVQQRSALLRQERADAAWLEAIEETIASHGIAVAAARRLVTVQLSNLAGTACPGFPRVLVGIQGALEDWLEEGPALAAEERLRSALAVSRRADAESGGAAFGPHRSDVVVRHAASGRSAQDCSTGEQKMLLIALLLAGARLQKRERGASPLLLLDDIVAHLDAPHRQAVFDAVADLAAQAWYAGTERAPFQPLAQRAQFLALASGEADRASLRHGAATAERGSCHE
jgi:DNA replication and repair protein RecF